MEEKIKILLVDDHHLITEAWTVLLSLVESFEVIGTSKTADEALEFCMTHRPDIVLMDINLQGSNGMDATERITNTLAKTRVIGLSLHEDVAIVKRLMAKGARGYLSKNCGKQELTEAIQKVYNGELYFSEEIRAKLFSEIMDADKKDPKIELTMKEIDVVKLISKGLTSKEIATDLFISPRTVETHRHNILKKLKLQNAAQIGSWARENGYF